jgi:hypothetical protein
MLIVTLHNIHTDKDDVATYDARVKVNYVTIWDGKVGPHKRGDGAAKLLRKLADAMDEDPKGVL